MMSTLKPKHRPFCFSVKGHVKMLRMVFGLLTAVCCIADGVLIYRKLLFNPSGPYQKRTIHDKI
ncbi:chemokine-like factor isoform X5 [Callorhinus ursinus]|uniref:Chemokine-like factor isoform X4 n=1 Tax=Zalophus californianus TaxID=9704 RepID=A0A6J2F4Q9_ZALCA|nr:chemokine-like factor isoform X4 [Zalophus californianus]